MMKNVITTFGAILLLTNCSGGSGAEDRGLDGNYNLPGFNQAALMSGSCTERAVSVGTEEDTSIAEAADNAAPAIGGDTEADSPASARPANRITAPEPAPTRTSSPAVRPLGSMYVGPEAEYRVRLHGDSFSITRNGQSVLTGTYRQLDENTMEITVQGGTALVDFTIEGNAIILYGDCGGLPGESSNLPGLDDGSSDFEFEGENDELDAREA